MSVHRIDDLIDVAHNAMDDDLDVQKIYEWKEEAVEYLTEHLGPEHYYTQSFTTYMEEIEHKNLLTAGGVLSAAREEIRRECSCLHSADLEDGI